QLGLGAGSHKFRLLYAGRELSRDDRTLQEEDVKDSVTIQAAGCRPQQPGADQTNFQTQSLPNTTALATASSAFSAPGRQENDHDSRVTSDPRAMEVDKDSNVEDGLPVTGPSEMRSALGLGLGSGDGFDGNGKVDAATRCRNNSEVPLHELESQRSLDTLFVLMESGHGIGRLVWELLMKMPTNQQLLEQLQSIGTGPSGGADEHICPLFQLLNASASRLLYSLMTVDALLSQDITPVSPDARDAAVAQGIAAAATRAKHMGSGAVSSSPVAETQGVGEVRRVDGVGCYGVDFPVEESTKEPVGE
ncbi:unnamed protein product, partial [Choristocarpus tenellus]